MLHCNNNNCQAVYYQCLIYTQGVVVLTIHASHDANLLIDDKLLFIYLSFVTIYMI